MTAINPPTLKLDGCELTIRDEGGRLATRGNVVRSTTSESSSKFARRSPSTPARGLSRRYGRPEAAVAARHEVAAASQRFQMGNDDDDVTLACLESTTS